MENLQEQIKDQKRIEEQEKPRKMVGTMAKIDDSVKKKVPELRFPGFTNDWEQRKLEELGNLNRGKSKHRPRNDSRLFGGEYPFIQTGDVAKAPLFLTEYSQTYSEFGIQQSKLWDIGTLLITIAANVADTTILGIKAAFPDSVIGFESTSCDVVFIKNYIDIKSDLLKRKAETSSQANLNLAKLKEMNLNVPKLKEQQKIGSFFKQLDDTIALHQRKLDLLKEQKKGFLQKMFPKNGAKVPELRFAGFADDWEERKFKDILKTHSSRSYLAGVSENGEYEVIQQGNKPIVGYSDGEPFTDYKDVTLLGDHTVSLYKPKSPFFVATDGVKILSADNFEGNYLYTTLERYKPEPQGYKRHFTILKNQDVWFTENMEEQQKIGSFFKQLDDTIALHQRKLDLLKEQKKGFLQKMFV
ncbi:MAG: restriction endonuclease subunit S [Lactococcus lactis]|nr:restriction endonuclease subunit S [Lactococcus lactis]